MMEMKTELVHGTDAQDAAEICRTLALRPMFWRPTYLEISAWIEHLPFAFWLMAVHRPKVFVELGSHYGTSYFAFCQAVERLGIDTRCFAVDTWKGDEHAGFYDDKVINQVRAHNDANYSGFSRLVRSTFDDALPHFSDGTIDLLHIDGLHTYEAVRHDFEAWLPKLSDNAVIVMHDTNVRERNFGVFKLFEELKKDYPAFEFSHGHGLGVIYKGNLQNPLLQRLFASESDPVAKPIVQEMFSRLGRGCADSLAADRNAASTQKFKGDVNKHTKQIDELKQTLDKVKADLATRTKELHDTKVRLQKQIEENAGERAQLLERATLLEQLRKELKEDVVRQQARIDQLEAQVVSQIESLQSASTLTLTHQRALLQAETSLEEISRQLEASQHESRVLKDENASLKSANGILDAQKARQAAELEAARASVVQLRTAALETQKKEQDSAANQLKAAEETIQRLKKENASLQAEKTKLAASVAQRFEELAKLTQRLANAEKSQRTQADQVKGNAVDVTASNVSQMTLEAQSKDERLNELAAERDQAQNLLRKREDEFQRVLQQLAQSAVMESVPATRTGGLKGIAETLFKQKGNRQQQRLARQVALVRRSGLFDENWYLERYPDVAQNKMDPVVHFLRFGAAEGRDPGPLFSTTTYVANNPDVAESAINPLVHYINHGSKEARTVYGSQVN